MTLTAQRADHAAGQVEGAVQSSRVRRFRHVVVCTALAALAFLQAPGTTVPDTKLDLTSDPQGLLGRALHLWDPAGAFGQVQNQGYGYLWPAGPFHAVLDLAGFPPWVIQRLWWALLLCVAYLGLVRLAARLGIGTDTARLIAGVAFALSPRIITELGPISIEAWPTAVAPWVVIPLVDAARGAPLRRSAALSAVAVACVGGVNAAATLAVLPLAALWLAVATPRAVVGRLTAWWGLFVVMATMWWVVPLLILGRYSPPFLDYIENAGVTTAPTSLIEVLRGTSHWISYLADNSGPTWSAAWLLLSSPVIVLNTVVIVVAGLVGLARPGMPHRRWAVTAVLAGVAMVAFGHVAAVDGLFAAQQRELLDGALAPLRNVHKFDVVLRVPLLLGACHLLGLLLRAAAVTRTSGSGRDVAARRARVRRGTALLVALTAVCGAAAPAIGGAIPPRGTYSDLPGYWADAARWLDERAEHGTVLLTPASTFGDYYWGRPGDEPLQVLLDRPWAVRNAVPLAPPGTIRMLDAVESRLATGQGSPALAGYLARAGVRYVVIRNDLNYATVGASRPLLVHQAVSRSPGLKVVATFGPQVGGGNQLGRLVDQDLDVPFPAVEVIAVDAPVERVSAYPQREVVALDGAPESVLALGESGQLNDAPTVLAVDRVDSLTPGRTVLTDGFRSRNVFFGRVADASSETVPFARSADGGPVRDYLPPGADRRLTVSRFVGAESVEASSSASSALAFGGARPERSPWAAFDGLAHTGWWSDPGAAPVGQWAEVRYRAGRAVPAVDVELDTAAGVTATRLRIVTDRGSVDGTVTDGVARVPLPWPSVRRVRVQVTAIDGDHAFGSVGFREVRTGAPSVQRPLVLPRPAAVPSTVAFSAATGDRDGCYRVVDRPVCATGLARLSEDSAGIDRIADVGEPGRFRVSVRGRIAAGPALDRLLAEHRTGLVAEASSSAVPDPAGQAPSAVDGERGTGWVAAPGDSAPWLRFRWTGMRELDGLRLDHDGALAASVPREVTVESPHGVRRGTLEKGVLTFRTPLTTDQVTIRFGRSDLASSIEPYTRQLSLLPVGTSEISFLGAPDLGVTHDPDTRVVTACGTGPTVRTGSSVVQTAVSATYGQLADLSTVLLLPCDDETVDVGAGPQRITAASTDLVRTTGLELNRVGATLPSQDAVDRVGTTVGEWSATERSVRVAARPEDALLVVRENSNRGWRATLDGRPLTSVTVDGWQQGYLVPRGGEGTVRLVYTPDRPYRVALVFGALAAIAVFAAAVGRRGLPLGPAPVLMSRRTWVPAALLGGIALVLATGWWGVGAAVLSAVVAHRLGTRASAGLRTLALIVSLGAGGIALTVAHWPSPSYAGRASWVQLLCVLALGVLWASVLPRTRRVRRGSASA